MNFKERLLLLLMIEAVGLFCQNSIRKCSKEVSNCPITKELWYKRYEEFPCFKEGLNYTCMMAVGGVLVEACINDYEIIAFTGSRCPFIHSCDGIEPVLAIEGNWPLCPEDVFGCPPADHPVYTVYHMYKYPACIVRNVTELLTTKTTTLEVLTSPTTHATVANVTTTNTTNGQVAYNEMPGIVAGVIIGAVFVLLSIVAVCIWKISRIRRGKRKRVDDQFELCNITPGTNGVSDPLLPEFDETYLKNPSTQPDLDTEEKTMHMPPDPEETYLKRPSTPPDSDTKEKTMHMPPDPDTALLVSTSVTVVHPSHLEKETKEKVEAILLSVLEIMFCKEIGTGINEDEVSALFDMFNDLQIISKKFLDIWHGQFCKCGKHFGQKMLLKFIESAADQCSHGKNKFDHFKVHVIPYLVSTLKISTRNIYHIFEDCGAIPVSVVQSSVHSYWKFDCIRNLDMLWDKYSNGELSNALQDSFNSTEVLCLLKVDKISFKMEILQKDFIKYRATLEKNVPGADRLQTLDLSTVKSPVETSTVGTVKATIKTTEGDSMVDSTEALKFDHSKRSDKTTETEYSKHFEKKEASLRDPLSDPDIAEMKREMEAPYADSLTTRFNTDLTTERNPMKRKLYEVNKRLSESPTALSYIFKSHYMRPRELLYASVSLASLNESYGLNLSMAENVMYTRRSVTMSEGSMDMGFSYQSQKTLMSTEAKSDTKHSCVFILGEQGCGKTSYCLHLLRQWCKGKELQEFDYVFYVDSSILQCAKKSISNLVSYAVFGSYDSHKNDVDQILRNERCFILVDGGQYIKGNLHHHLSSTEQLIRQYSNCVFVFPMRPADFANLDEMYLPKDDYIIYKLKFDVKAMASLYSQIIIDKHESEISIPQRVKKQTASQNLTKELTLQQKKTGSNTGLQATESDDFRGEGESDNKTKVARNLSDYDQRFQKSSIAGATEETRLEQKIQERVSEYDRPELEFYKIKEVLEKVLDANYDSVMSIPMLGSICVELIAKGKDVPRNITSLSLCLVEKLVGQNEAMIEKGDKSVKSSSLFMSYKNIYRNVGALCKLGKVAYDSIFSTTPELLDFKILEECLQNREISLSMKTGLLVSLQALSDKVSDKPPVRFLHRSIQDTLVAMYIVTEKDQVFETFCQRLTSVDVIINMSDVIMMICGLIPNLGCRMSKYINYVLDEDSTFSSHREHQYTRNIVREMYKLQLSWFIEYKNALTPTRGDPKDTFYVSDIYIDEESDIETITKTATLMSDKNNIVTSLYTDDVPIESDLPDKVLNNFLAYNTSLRSICIRVWDTCRTIEPLSLPSLTVLKLRKVNIQSASTDDEVTKPLLYNLPMLQSLHLEEIQLNGRILGVTSIKGKMPMLKKIYIYHVNMSDQSIALAPDMTVIEIIELTNVYMPPHGWMKFIKSLINIPNSFAIRLYGSDIDSQSKEIVQTNKLFDVESDNRNVLIFRKLSL